MKKSILLWVVTLSICTNCKTNIVDNTAAISKINEFYKVKSDYVSQFKSSNGIIIDDSVLLNMENKEKILNDSWDRLNTEKLYIISCLLEFENDESYSLYGRDFLDSDITIKKIPNKIHALYLIEGLIQNDYLFNRKWLNTNGGKLNYFKNDSFNFIYDSCVINNVSVSIDKEVPLKDYENNLTEAWNLYRKWYKDNSTSKIVMCISPLRKSCLKWNEIDYRNAYDFPFEGQKDTVKYQRTEEVRNELRSKLSRYNIRIGDGCN